ncbi:MAG: preprotein translocase subunit YajC [Pirellulaceae bacterium]|nr:preprotein translocase subunit YajC [Pirellulaceae bacterium]
MADWVRCVALFAQDAGPAAGGKGILGDLSFLPVMLAIGIMFYLMLIRPEQKRKAQITQMQQGLKKNDRVVTIGGIYGTVVNTGQGSDEVTIRIDDNTKMRIERGSIKRILTEDKASADEEKKDSG